MSPPTDNESARLQASIQQDGISPVLLDYARREMTALEGYDLLALIDDHYRQDRNEAAALVVQRINADLALAGETKSVNTTALQRARAWRDFQKKEPRKAAAVRAGKVSLYAALFDRKRYDRTGEKPKKRGQSSVDEPQAPKDKFQLAREEQARTRLFDAKKQYESMHNAPRGKLNLPLVRRIQSIQEQLDDIYELTPEDAVLGYDPELARMFTPSRAEWWLKFCALNEERWHREVPDLPPIPNKRIIPLSERDLNSMERAALDWLRKNTTTESNLSEGVTATALALALRCPESQARALLTKLHRNDLAEVVGDVDDYKLYVATQPPRPPS